MRYEYRNKQGDTRIVEAPMAEAPPWTLTFRPDGSWDECAANDPLAWTRVHSFLTNGNLIKDRYPIVSHTLPKGIKGLPRGRNGETVVRSRRDEEIVKRAGYAQRDW
jgi:hypothetical protein